MAEFTTSGLEPNKTERLLAGHGTATEKVSTDGGVTEEGVICCDGKQPAMHSALIVQRCARL